MSLLHEKSEVEMESMVVEELLGKFWLKQSRIKGEGKGSESGSSDSPCLSRPKGLMIGMLS
jgi:hypothetical protein